MNFSLERRIGGGFILGLLVLGAVGGSSCLASIRAIRTSAWVQHTHDVIMAMEELSKSLYAAEAGQRGYIITGNEQHLERYYLALSSIDRQSKEVTRLTVDNPEQQDRLKVLRPMVQERIELLNEALQARRTGGLTASQRLISQDIGRLLSQDIQTSLNDLLLEEERLLEERSRQANSSAWLTTIMIGGSIFLSFAFVPVAVLNISQELEHRKRLDKRLQDSEAQLKSQLTELQDRRKEILQLAELSEFLQSCFDLSEAYTNLSEMMRQILPGTSGAILTISESKNLVEPVSTWGDTEKVQEIFAPSDCWSIRRGRPFFMSDFHEGHLHCQHIESPFPSQAFCVPMMAQGDALGLLHVTTSGSAKLSDEKQSLTIAVAEHIAIAIANLKLRETLKSQSIRDPLTGLFNRRYMEESMERERVRAERVSQNLSVLMLDVDQFKLFNDTFGHSAGDEVLKELGQYLKGTLQNSDIACRYGGEEFMLLLPDTSPEDAAARADQMREEIRRLPMQYQDRPISSITISIGVASFPQDGNTMKAVLKAAESALYKAKQEGRDRVETA